MTWAQRLKRVFGIDIETRPDCGGAALPRAAPAGTVRLIRITRQALPGAATPAARQWWRLAWWLALVEMRASGAMVRLVQGLKCRAGPLLRSDRRPTGGADGREEGLPLDKNTVYPSIRARLRTGHPMTISGCPQPRPSLNGQRLPRTPLIYTLWHEEYGNSRDKRRRDARTARADSRLRGRTGRGRQLGIGSPAPGGQNNSVSNWRTFERISAKRIS